MALSRDWRVASTRAAAPSETLPTGRVRAESPHQPSLKAPKSTETMRFPSRGAICTIGSELALCGDADAAHYAAAKGAIHAFTKSLAVEAAPHGVRVNCVAPGPTDTALMTAEMRDPAYVESLVLQRLVAPGEIAAAVRFVTRGAHNLVGQVISPNAGAVV